jgi:chromate transport protein ChrA
VLQYRAYFLTELSSALLGLAGDVPGVAVVGVLPSCFQAAESEPEAVAELVLAPEVSVAVLVVSVVLQAARPAHRAAAKRALVMFMMSSFIRD